MSKVVTGLISLRHRSRRRRFDDQRPTPASAPLALMWITGGGVGIFRSFLDAFDDCDEGMRKALSGWIGDDLADLLELRRRVELMVGLGLWTQAQRDIWWRCLTLRMNILVRGEQYPFADVVEAVAQLREMARVRAQEDPAPQED